MARRPGAGRGDPYVWLAGSGLGLCLVMIVGLLFVILVNGLGFFWPGRLTLITTTGGEHLLGEVVAREQVPGPVHAPPPYRIQLKVGNRDLLGSDFRWIEEREIAARAEPRDAFYVERHEYGPLLGTPVRLTRGGDVVAEDTSEVAARFPSLLRQAAAHRAAIRDIERDRLGAINRQIERTRLELGRAGRAQRPGDDSTGERRRLEQASQALQARYESEQQALDVLLESAAAERVTFRTADAQEKELRVLDIYRAYAANELSWFERLRVYLDRLWVFISEEPRESNTEGGIFPAIFGTVMMVILMSLAAVPFGVLAALYLREYARQGVLVRTVRIAVNNLAGVPSIVFGVFGLGFFVYFVGGGIDRVFYSDTLPTPTYGTGGILWASLTLALLTVPVVIVASEEALAAVPRSMREASLAMGATRFQTIVRVVLPAAAPGIMTGLILAMARGAGEVAPLMITGVVKLAPDLPLDGTFPFFHLERQFMHLGFHIYDVGFQSPNVEAAKPMVYTTTLFLLAIVIALNMTAIAVRNRLRRRYQAGAF